MAGGFCSRTCSFSNSVFLYPNISSPLLILCCWLLSLAFLQKACVFLPSFPPFASLSHIAILSFHYLLLCSQEGFCLPFPLLLFFSPSFHLGLGGKEKKVKEEERKRTQALHPLPSFSCALSLPWLSAKWIRLSDGNFITSPPSPFPSPSVLRRETKVFARLSPMAAAKASPRSLPPFGSSHFGKGESVGGPPSDGRAATLLFGSHSLHTRTLPNRYIFIPPFLPSNLPPPCTTRMYAYCARTSDGHLRRELAIP